MNLALTLLCEPPRSAPGPQQAGLEDLARLAAELSARLHAPVPLVRACLRDARPPGVILLHAELSAQAVLAECPAGERASLAARLLPLAVSEKGVCDMADALALAGAVTNFGLSLWTGAAPGDAGASGVVGLRALAPAIGAAVDTVRVPASARYAHLVGAAHHGLPHLLADYLRAYAAR